MAREANKVGVAPRGVGKYFAQIAIVFAVQFAAGKLGDALAIINSGGIGPVWPASGVALAALLLLGYQVWPGVAAGAFLLTFLSPIPHLAAAGYAAGTTFAALTGTFLLRRVVNFRTSLSRLRDAVGLIMFGAFGSSIVSASIGVSLLYAAHVRGWSGFGSAWLIYWLGDSMGVLLVTPLVLTFPNLLRIRPRVRIAEFAVLILLLTVACFIVFGDLPLVPVRLHVLAFAVLPFVMWAAIRFGMSGATLSILFIVTIATIETAAGSGPFAQNTPFLNAVLLDVFFAVLSVSGTTLAAVVAEREQAEREREQFVRAQAATEARLRLATIVESSDDAIIGKDMNGRIMDWNKGAERLYGYSAVEVIGKPISLLVTHDRSDDFEKIMRKVNLGDSVRHYETVHQKRDGTCVEVSLTVSPIFDTEGRIVGSSGIGRDISERKRQEAVLRESEERFRLLADTAPALIWMSGTDKLCIYFNKPWLDFTGRSMDSELGNGWAEGVYPGDLQTFLDTYTHAFDRREEFRMEYRLRRYDGKYRWILDVGVPRFNQDGSLAGYIGIGVDMTERKMAEEALRASEERLRLAQQAAGIGTFERNVRTGVITWTPEMESIYGLPPGGFGQTRTAFENMVHPGDRARVIELLDWALKTGQPTAGEWRVVWPDGSVHWIAGRWQAFMDESGEPSRVVGVDIDVTERKQTEEGLRKSEERFRLAAQAGKMYAYEWDVATDEVVRSEEYANVLGFSEQGKQLTRQQLLGRVHSDDRALFLGSVDQLTPENPTTLARYRVLRPDGSVVWLEKSARAFFDEQGKMLRVIGMVADMTERKRAEDAQRESEGKFRLLLDSTAEAIYGIDLEHRCTFCNPACLRALGYERTEEVLGKNMHDLLHHTRADGTLFPIEECQVHWVTQTGEGVHAEGDVFWRANGTSFPTEYWSHPQRRGQELVGAVVAFIDITERKLAEAAVANVSRKLIEAQEQERTRIGRELHDDIGQRLAMLAIELQQLHENSLILPEVRSRTGELQKQISEIAADIQSLSHELHSAKLEYLGLAGAIRGFCREFGEQQKVEVDFQTHDLPGRLSPDISLCFFRVLQEALHNAVKHSGVRHFEIRLWGTSDEVHLRVRDSGLGFDREAAKTSQGLGLISMEERLKLLKGTLLIGSQPNRGTTIHARVPFSLSSDSMRAAG